MVIQGTDQKGAMLNRIAALYRGVTMSGLLRLVLVAWDANPV